MVPPHKAIVCHLVLPRAQLFPAFTPGTLMQLWNTDLRRRWSAHVFQQLVAMGAARHIPGLSRHYIVWAADAIPVSGAQAFFSEDKAVFLTGAFHRGMTRAEAQHQAIAHHQAFERLVGLPMLHPGAQFDADKPTPLPDYLSESWEAHQVVVRREYVLVASCVVRFVTSHSRLCPSRYMDAMLTHIEQRAKVDRGQWMYAVAAALQLPDHEYFADAFSFAEMWVGLRGRNVGVVTHAMACGCGHCAR